VRRLVAGGPNERYEVRCAVLEDGTTSPAADALDALAAGLFENDTDRKEGDPWPDEEQPTDLANLMAEIRLLISDGVPSHQRAIQALNNGVWEFKVSRKRFTFYDTLGDGTYDPKPRIRDRSESEFPDSPFWWFPDLDQELRLGHVFPKTDALAGKKNTDMSERVREEDLRHDERQTGFGELEATNPSQEG